ncbi:hypothetical protein PTTW11_11099 [Pyrenophora teres f. teres]|uniref:Uncharacterized protein n=1 Tax=Pyrenophora teres f. teres TaxID=97479 RepID=A0A6S6WH83_9PLEO|nr:hypothetical protein PTTW11_11099 [Pyrenophora teres f. teres]
MSELMKSEGLCSDVRLGRTRPKEIFSCAIDIVYRLGTTRPLDPDCSDPESRQVQHSGRYSRIANDPCPICMSKYPTPDCVRPRGTARCLKASFVAAPANDI